MVFSGTTFLFLFLPLLIFLYFIRGGIRWRNAVLLVFSLLFYSWGEPVWALGMVLETYINHFFALRIYKSRKKRARRRMLSIAVFVSLVGLVYFKYSAFLVNSVLALFGAEARMAARHLPIGISFYTFQILTYTVDVYRGKAEPQKRFSDTLLYIACFPQLIAGPIVQYADVAGQLTERSTSMRDFGLGMERFVLGLSKKILLANLCGQMLDATRLASGTEELSFLGAWLSAVLYSMQLFFDFSAYSDMAIGLGRVFGFTYKENFDHPYISRTVTEFWRRWHISLSAFFRDYVYIPLGGNRVSPGRNVLNLLAVWALTGLWHGASWNFVCWGLYYFVFLMLEKFVLRRFLSRWPDALRRLFTLMIVAIGWVLFYYTDLGQGLSHILAMFGLVSGPEGLHRAALIDETAVLVLKQYSFFLPAAMLCCLPVVNWLNRLFSATKKSRRIGHVLGLIALSGLLVLSVLFLLGQTYNPFIYFRF